MDDMRTSKIKTDVFFSVLKITNIKINTEVENELKKLYENNGMIDYKDALSKLSANLVEDKPLNNDWILRSNNSSMRSSVYTSSTNRIRAAPLQEKLSKTLYSTAIEEKNEDEIDKADEKSIKLSEDARSQFVPYPTSTNQHKGFHRSARSSIANHKRGITPGPNVPIKLIKPINNLHETGFNIITNRDKNNLSTSIDQHRDEKMITQAERDYPDYTKSEYSFEYTKVKGSKKFSTQRIARKYHDYYNKKKEREIPAVIKELLNDHERLANLIEDAYSLKASFSEQDLCLIEDGIFDTVLKNFEILDTSHSKQISYDFYKLLEGTKKPLDNSLKDQLIIKLKGSDSGAITYNRILQLFDLYKFMVSRENNYYADKKLGHGYRPISDSHVKSKF